MGFFITKSQFLWVIIINKIKGLQLYNPHYPLIYIITPPNLNINKKLHVFSSNLYQIHAYFCLYLSSVWVIYSTLVNSEGVRTKRMRDPSAAYISYLLFYIYYDDDINIRLVFSLYLNTWSPYPSFQRNNNDGNIVVVTPPITLWNFEQFVKVQTWLRRIKRKLSKIIRVINF